MNIFLPEETLAKKLITKGSWIVLFTLLTAPLGYIIRIYISRDLSIDEVGVLYSVIGFVGILSSYNDLGLTESLNYFLPKYVLRNKWNEIKTILYINLVMQTISGLLLGVGVYFWEPWLSQQYFHHPEARIVLYSMIGFFFVSSFSAVASSILVSLQNIFWSKCIEFFRMITTLGMVVVIATWYTGDMGFYASTWFFGAIVGLVFSFFVILAKYRRLFTEGRYIHEKSLYREYF